MRRRLAARAWLGAGGVAACLATGCGGSTSQGGPDPSGGAAHGGDASSGSGRAGGGAAGFGAGAGTGGNASVTGGSGASGAGAGDGGEPPGGSDGTGGATAVSSGGRPSDGTGGTPSAGSGGSSDGLCAGVLCAGLKNVRPGVPISCEKDACVLDASSCAPGFAHCSEDFRDGCETDLSLSTSCGACNVSCPPGNPVCGFANGAFECLSACFSETPVFCSNICVNLQTSFKHCGACDSPCVEAKNIDVGCRGGKCVTVSECYPGTADCAPGVDCEPLDTAENCGACGRNNCGAAHASLDCSDPSGCLPPVCDSGYANCDRTNPDCEVPYGGGCWPSYLGTVKLPGVLRVTTATYGSDGSYFIAGVFSGELDFDPSSATDILDAGANEHVFVTKLDASGGYGWTRAFGNDFSWTAVASAAGANGAIAVTGTFMDVADFDPGAGSLPLGSTGTRRAYLVQLTSQGTLAWARAWSSGTQATAIAADGAAAFYVAGKFYGIADLDPGPGTVERDSELAEGYVVRLNAAGNYVRGQTHIPCWSLAVARDGKLWCLDGGTFPSGVSAYNQLGEATFGASLTFMLPPAAIAAGADGAIYVAGYFIGPIDVLSDDPGRRRVAPMDQATALLVVLDSNGAFVRTRAVHGYEFKGLAAAPGGGVLALAEPSDRLATGPAWVFGYHPDGASTFRLAAGSSEGTPLLAANATEFFLAGAAETPTDFDPGTAVEENLQAGAYVSRFRF